MNPNSSRVFENNDWWVESAQKLHHKDNDPAFKVTGTERARLTGLGMDGLVRETVSRDIRGNETVSRAYLDRSAKTQTQVTDTPDSTQDQVVETRYGLTVSSTSSTGVTRAFAYDALGRRATTTDPRTGDNLAHYDALGRVDYVQDAAGNRTRFEYEPATGRKSAQVDAQGRATRWEYDSMGRVVHEWGATYPVSYDYDEYGRKVRMSTYRGGSGWFAPTWPASPGDSDDTHWVYDEPTGLLTHKIYDDGHGPAYAYTADGKLDTRTWARVDENGYPLTTRYAYDLATGDLTLVDYSDATPDVGFAYDRLGRKTRVTDAAGERAFAYDETLALHSESQSGLYTTTLIRARDTLGREAGFTTGDDYAVTYGYDPKGRLNGVGWNVDGMTGRTDYTYVPNSDLLAGMESVRTDGAGYTPVSADYAYEPHRDLKTMVKNRVAERVISQYDYVYNAIGFRESVVNTGEAFDQPGFNKYQYNDRGELTESSRYLGENPADTTNPVAPEYRSYAYDPIGNRQQVVDWDQQQSHARTTDYDTNNLNQYSQTVSHTQDPQTGETSSFIYDLDGNMTSVSDSHGVTAYTWNCENQLLAVEKQNPQQGDLQLTFAYDYMGRRVGKTVYKYDSGSWIKEKEILFSWDAWNLYEESFEQVGSEKIKQYVWGLDLSDTLHGVGGIGGLAVMIMDGSEYYFCYDGNGDINEIVDTSKVFNKYYMVSISNFSFQTKYFDYETRMANYGYRYYTMNIERWLNPDPIAELGGKNIYTYLGNNSINFVDKLGMIKYDVDGKSCKLSVILTLSPLFNDGNLNGEHVVWTKQMKDQYESESKRVVNSYFSNQSYRCYSSKDCCQCKDGIAVSFNLVYDHQNPDFEINVGINDIEGWRSSMTNWRSWDLFPEDKGASPGNEQIIILHEIGHMLNMPHPGQRLPEDIRPGLGDDADYRADMESLMGGGNILRVIDFDEAFCQHIDANFGSAKGGGSCSPWCGR